MKFLVSSGVSLGFVVLGSLAQGRFIHPGLLHARSDLERIRTAVAAKKGPIYGGFKILEESPYARADYRMRGPFPEWGRAPNIRKGETESDALAVY